MSLNKFEWDCINCVRCSLCKWVDPWELTSERFAKVCPAVARYLYDAYSSQGKMDVALGLMRGELELNESVMDIVYKCNLCGACDIMCKRSRELEPLQLFKALRAKCVEEGQIVPDHMFVLDGLKKEDNVFGEPKAKRGDWAKDLGIKDISKEKVDVMFHTGCRFSYNEDLWGVVQGAVKLLQMAGVNVGIAGREESCCGGRVYELGFQGEATNYAEDMQSRVNASGASILVTPCSDCYATFKYTYPSMGKNLPVEVLHITEYLERLLKEGRLNLTKDLGMKVTYHDPCHLGRLSEPYIPWEGSRGRFGRHTPPKEFRRGTLGCYDTPRNVIRQLPGVELVEMERIREYSWCCGSGGGVWEAYPDFASWTAGERIEEALSTGAEALVTACPWCERAFKDAVGESGAPIKVYDLTELVGLAVGDDKKKSKK
jgi:Fe-S oxidoreductase